LSQVHPKYFGKAKTSALKSPSLTIRLGRRGVAGFGLTGWSVLLSLFVGVADSTKNGGINPIPNKVWDGLKASATKTKSIHPPPTSKKIILSCSPPLP